MTQTKRILILLVIFVAAASGTECTTNLDCSATMSCSSSNQTCVDACSGACGLNAECAVANHEPSCSCPSGYTGDPFVTCAKDRNSTANPCDPNPCGNNTVCTNTNGTAACSCQTGYTGSPNCQPECTTNSDCSATMNCSNQACVDACSGACGQNAECSVANHEASCSCPAGYEGDPYTDCVA